MSNVVVSLERVPLKRTAKRVHLTNESIERLRLQPGERCYDDSVPGFFVVRGKGANPLLSFRVMADPPKQARLKLGLGKTLERTVGTWPEISAAKARAEAQRFVGMIKGGVDPKEPERDIEGPTLSGAHDRYIAALQKKVDAGDRQPSTIEFYDKSIHRLPKRLLNIPLATLGTRRGLLVDAHTDLTRTSGKVAADHSMVALRAVYNHALKTWPDLPSNPVIAVDLNGIPDRAEDGLGLGDLKAWWAEVQKLRNPVRRQLLLFILLTGLRSTEACTAKRAHLDEAEKTLFVPKPKGGSRRAFDLPLSDPAIAAIAEARRAWEAAGHPPSDYLFPSAHSEKGHFSSARAERRGKNGERDNSIASGHALRHSFATAAEAVGFVEESYGPLLNHKPKSVTGKYPNRKKNNALYRVIANDIGNAIIKAIGDA